MCVLRQACIFGVACVYGARAAKHFVHTGPTASSIFGLQQQRFLALVLLGQAQGDGIFSDSLVGPGCSRGRVHEILLGGVKSRE